VLFPCVYSLWVGNNIDDAERGQYVIAELEKQTQIKRAKIPRKTGVMMREVLYCISLFIGFGLIWLMFGFSAWLFCWFSLWDGEPKNLLTLDGPDKDALGLMIICGLLSWWVVLEIMIEDHKHGIKSKFGFWKYNSKGRRFLDKLES